MTKANNMREEILGEFKKEFVGDALNYPIGDMSWIDIKLWLDQAITRVVESVPCEEMKKVRKDTDSAIDDLMLDFHLIGYNQHVQEIKHWKQQWLGEGEK